MYYCDTCRKVHWPDQCRTVTVIISFDGHQTVLQVTTDASGVTTTQRPIKVSDLEALYQLPDENLKLCRPCSVSDRVNGYIHECDGGGCECPWCSIVETVNEMAEDWDYREREQSWPEK